MKKTLAIIAISCIAFMGHSQSMLDKLKKKKDSLDKKVNSIITPSSQPALTNEEVIKGLKEALTIGTNSSSTMASKMDGYYKNPRIFIPWPQEAAEMRTKLMSLGMEKKIIEFETSLNRAAEEAAKNAAKVFIDAITNMSVSDGFAILKGNDTAATHFLRQTT
jgi:hypothetical protein